MQDRLVIGPFPFGPLRRPKLLPNLGNGHCFPTKVPRAEAQHRRALASVCDRSLPEIRNFLSATTSPEPPSHF
ncbi:hypothetical protein VTN77DRAFT_8866 [Rasamsonia byssochlamydoides]|uniref:uncharacterized protein n=1 Tax=Rasamsonia byssochlamydoides TaxID=89139 RepID=UPI0037439748